MKKQTIWSMQMGRHWFILRLSDAQVLEQKYLRDAQHKAAVALRAIAVSENGIVYVWSLLTEEIMNDGVWDQIAGKWKQFKGDVRSRWGDLTDDELEQIAGEREKLAGKIQERYGITRQEADRQIDEWAERMKF